MFNGKSKEEKFSILNSSFDTNSDTSCPSSNKDDANDFSHKLQVRH